MKESMIRKTRKHKWIPLRTREIETIELPGSIKIKTYETIYTLTKKQSMATKQKKQKTFTNKLSSYQPISFKVVKKIVIDDFKATADGFSDYACKCYTIYLKKTKNISQLINVIASIQDGTIIEAYEFLLDLIVSD